MVECPFCNTKPEKFLPFGKSSTVLFQLNVIGGKLRDNVKCPGCGSIDRERLVFIYLENKTPVFTENLKLLHIAPEENLAKVFKEHKNIEYTTGDLYSDSADMKIDITDISFEDNTFDVIICNHVLEHVENDLKAMSELYRVLRPGGWAILQVPVSPVLKRTYQDRNIVTPLQRHYAYGQGDHVRIYSWDYKIRLMTSGFNVNIYNIRDEYPDLVEKYALNPDENLYIALKAFNEA